MSTPEAAKDCENIDSCDDCTMLEQRLWAASERYVSLIVEHDQMIRDGEPNAGILVNAIKGARLTRNAAGRLLLYHRIHHEDLSRSREEPRHNVRTASA